MPLDTTLPMGASAALLDQLREIKRRDEEVEVESTQARERWLQAVGTLLVAVRGWLAPALREGLARIDAASVHVTEDDVGVYDAPALKVMFPASREVWVRPIGTLRVGGQGIVDVVSSQSRALLVLNRAGVWKIRGPGPTATLVPLDAETFSRALGELLS